MVTKANEKIFLAGRGPDKTNGQILHCQEKSFLKKLFMKKKKKSVHERTDKKHSVSGPNVQVGTNCGCCCLRDSEGWWESREGATNVKYTPFSSRI